MEFDIFLEYETIFFFLYEQTINIIPPPPPRFLSIGFGLEISNSSKLNSFMVNGQGSLSDMFSGCQLYVQLLVLLKYL